MFTVPEREHDGVGLDAGDPAHRDEDAMPVLQLDDQAEDARWLAVERSVVDGLAHAAELITVRVEYADAGEPGDEDPGPSLTTPPAAAHEGQS